CCVPCGLRRDDRTIRPASVFTSSGRTVPIRARAIHGALDATPGRQDTAHLGVAIGSSVGAAQVVVTSPMALDLRLPMKEPRQRIAEAAFRLGYADSRPWMACGGSSGMDACRAGEHAPVGTPLCPKPAHRPSICRRAFLLIGRSPA